MFVNATKSGTSFFLFIRFIVVSVATIGAAGTC
jgi:hypothetical protein